MFFDIRRRTDQNSAEWFVYRTDQAVETIERRINDYIQILKGGKGLFMVTDEVTREIWKTYVKTLNVHDKYPGIQGIGYSEYIPSDRLEAHINRIRGEGFPKYRVKPEYAREEYTSIIYLEPFDWRNQRAFGFDMFSEPIRNKAMARARDTGRPALSGRVTLVQETTEDVQPGFLIYIPVYKRGSDPTTPEARRQSLKGYVYSPFRAGDLMTTLLEKNFPDIDIEIYDNGIFSRDALIYNSDTVLNYHTDASRPGRLESITIAGHTWSLYFTPRPGFQPSSDRNFALAVLAGGIIIGLLIFSVMYVISNARRSLKEANERIQANAELLQKVFYEAPAVVGIIKAIDQKFILVNPWLNELCGGQELIGRSAKEVPLTLQGKALHEILDEVLYTGRAYVGTEMGIQTGEKISYFNIVFQPLSEKGITHAVLFFAVEVTAMVEGRHQLSDINEELRTKNNQLIRMNNDLDNFIYTASHDLKAPISNIEGLISALKESDAYKDEDAMSLINMMTLSVEKFRQTILGLTEITRAQKSSEEEAEENEFSEALEEVMFSIQELITVSQAEIKIDFSAAPTIKFSRRNLRSIMYNLLSNALKYRSPDRKPEIIIRTEKKRDYIVLIVQDNGLGVNEKQKEKMFSMFSRLHDHVSGTGVGLYIVKRVIDNAGGKIEVESEVGKGLTFKIYF